MPPETNVTAYLPAKRRAHVIKTLNGSALTNSKGLLARDLLAPGMLENPLVVRSSRFIWRVGAVSEVQERCRRAESEVRKRKTET